MVVGLIGQRGPNAVLLVATVELLRVEEPAQLQHLLMGEPRAKENPNRRTAVAKDHVPLTEDGVPGRNGVNHQSLVALVEDLLDSDAVTIQKKRLVESLATEMTPKQNTLICHRVQSMAIGVLGANGRSAV